MLIGWQGTGFCADNNLDTKKDDKKRLTETVEIKGKYDNQGSFRFGLQLASGINYICNLQEAESNTALFGEFGVTFDKFLGSKTWALSSGVSYGAYNLTYTKEYDAPEMLVTEYKRVDLKGGKLNIPLNLKYRSGLIGERAKFYALAGASFFSPVGKSRQMETPITKSGIVLSQGKINDMEKENNSAAANLGCGFEFNTRALRTIAIGANYQRGMSLGGQTNNVDHVKVSVDFFF